MDRHLGCTYADKGPSMVCSARRDSIIMNAERSAARANVFFMRSMIQISLASQPIHPIEQRHYPKPMSRVLLPGLATQFEDGESAYASPIDVCLCETYESVRHPALPAQRASQQGAPSYGYNSSTSCQSASRLQESPTTRRNHHEPSCRSHRTGTAIRPGTCAMG